MSSYLHEGVQGGHVALSFFSSHQFGSSRFVVMATPYHKDGFSTLEVVPHERAGPNAPERDRRDFLSDAPQLDQSREGLQTNQHLDGLQLDRSANYPEVKPFAGAPEVVGEKSEETPVGKKSRRRPWWVIALIVGIISILAIALGAGLGAGLKKSGKSASTSSGSSSPGASPTVSASQTSSTGYVHRIASLTRLDDWKV